MRRIINSWATIRPKTFTKTFNAWINKESGKSLIITNAGVNIEEQKKEIIDLNKEKNNLNVFVLGDDIKGVPTANYLLLKSFEFKDDDIIIIGADDFFPPNNWDLILLDCFKNYDGCIIFEDGNPERFRPIVTIPVLTGKLLKELNGVIYHPSYKHNYADNEFFFNIDCFSYQIIQFS